MLVVYVIISILLCIYWMKLLLAKCCIILVLHHFIMRSFVQKLLISLRIQERFLCKLRFLVWVHWSIAFTILAIEIILIRKVSKSILLIFTLHFINLSFQISDFLLAILLLILSILRSLTIISRLRLSFWNSIFLEYFALERCSGSPSKNSSYSASLLFLFFAPLPPSSSSDG